MADYRAGIIGCGGIANSHAMAWNALENVELVAAVDIDDEALATFREKHSIPKGYNDADEMLRKEQLDFVSICTPTGLHEPQTIAAAESGVKGILCEKPMSYDLASVDRVIEACEKRGVKLAIGHQRRYMPQWLEGRRLIAEGAIGKPLFMYWGMGGGLLNIGSHAVDSFRMLMGDEEVKWVVGQAGRKTDRYERGIRIEDFSVMLFVFESGTRALVELDLPDDPQRRLETDDVNPFCIGTEGQFGYVRDRLKVWTKGDTAWRDVEVKGKNEAIAQAEALVKWVEGGPEHSCSARNNRKTIEVLMALYESMRKRDIIHLPIDIKTSPLHEMIDDGSLPIEVPGKYDIRAKKRR